MGKYSPVTQKANFNICSTKLRIRLQFSGFVYNVLSKVVGSDYSLHTKALLFQLPTPPPKPFINFDQK